MDESLHISFLDLSTRSYNGLRIGGISTVGDLLKVSPKDLEGIKNLGEKSITEILGIINELKSESTEITKASFQERQPVTPAPISTGTNPKEELISPISQPIAAHLGLAEVVAHLEETFNTVELAPKKKQDKVIKGIITNRLIALTPKTLKELAKQYRLTRERIRQLEIIGAERFRKKLCPACRTFLAAYAKSIAAMDGIQPYTEDYPTTKQGFSLFLALLKDYKKSIFFDFQENVWTNIDTNEFIESAISVLEESLPKDTLYSIPDIQKVLFKLSDYKRGDNTTKDYLFTKVIAVGFVKVIDKYSFGRPTKLLIAESIITRHFPNGISVQSKEDATRFYELAGEYNLLKYFGAKKRILTSVSNSKDRFILWARGTYISAKQITIKPSDLRSIKRWLQVRLQSRNDSVGTYGAFIQHKKELRAVGIPNEYALYSCMRHYFSGDFSFFRYPLVSSITARRRTMGAANHCVSVYLEDKEIPTSLADMVSDLGLKPHQILDAARKDNRILTCSLNRYIHISAIRLTYGARGKFNKLLRAIRNELTMRESISAISIFDKHSDFLIGANIPDARALYSYLSAKNTTTLHMPGFPNIFGKAKVMSS